MTDYSNYQWKYIALEHYMYAEPYAIIAYFLFSNQNEANLKLKNF